MAVHVVKAIALLTTAIVWWGVYAKINYWNSRPERAVFFHMRPVDYWNGIIQPVSAVVYVGGAAILLVWPIVLTWNSSRIWHFIAMVVMGTIIGFAIFMLWPLNIRRPEFNGGDLGESIMRAVFAVDDAANCFPSFHSFFAVLGAMVIHPYLSNSNWQVVAWLIACGVLISTVMTGQHYWVDIVGGVTLAVGCVWIVDAATGQKFMTKQLS